MQLERARGDAGERCEGGMKITQFVLSSCEKRMYDERGERERERRTNRGRIERIKTREQSAENHGET